MSLHAAPPTTYVQPRKRKKTRKPNQSNKDVSTKVDRDTNVVLKFRNYAPTDAPVPDETVKPQQSAARQAEEAIEKELQKSLVTRKDEAVRITPKSPNWDLKRDVEEKLKKLQRQTLRSIRDLVKERLATEQAENDSGSDSSSSGSGSDNDDDDDDDSSSNDS